MLNALVSLISSNKISKPPLTTLVPVIKPLDLTGSIKSVDPTAPTGSISPGSISPASSPIQVRESPSQTNGIQVQGVAEGICEI
jgi:hypothetical protein